MKNLDNAINCKKCGCNDIHAKPSSRKIGLYCANCNAWICWTTYSKICELYESKDAELRNDNVALKRICKQRGITTMQCSKCGCPLYDSSKPRVQYRFNLVNAKFCPKCGRKFII